MRHPGFALHEEAVLADLLADLDDTERCTGW
jgi:hypothetical protein